MHRIQMPIATLGLLFVATASLALPTDKGRSADVQASAIRYLAAFAENPANWPGPRMRPATALATTTPVQVPLQAPSNLIAGAPADLIMDQAAVIALAGTLRRPLARPALFDETDFATAAVAVDEPTAVAADVATETPLVAATDPLADDRLLSAADDALPVIAALDVMPQAADAAGSSRRIDVSVSEIAADPADLMADMAEADANFVVRDGGPDGPDTMMMSSDVLFAFGSATLADDALETLAAFGEEAENIAVLEVFGHTDAIGTEANNLRLGQERAEAVRDWLIANTAFTADRIIATGIGEGDPVAPNLLDNGDDNPAGRAQNRRVEFAFHDAGYQPQ